LNQQIIKEGQQHLELNDLEYLNFQDCTYIEKGWFLLYFNCTNNLFNKEYSPSGGIPTFTFEYFKK